MQMGERMHAWCELLESTFSLGAIDDQALPVQRLAVGLLHAILLLVVVRVLVAVSVACCPPRHADGSPLHASHHAVRRRDR